MLSQANMGKSFWAEAVSTACYLVNRSPHSALNFKSPQEVWYGKPVDYSTLKVFGCPTFIHVNDGKLEPRAKKCIFIGYDFGFKGYRVWCTQSRRVITSRDVVFDETCMIAPEKEISICNYYVGTHHDTEEDVELDDEHPHHEDGPSPRRPREATPQTQKKSIAEERAKRQIKPPSRYIEGCDYVQYALTVASQVETNNDDPCSFKEAMSQSDAGKWLIAMKQEMESLSKNNTWELCCAPKGKRIVGCKWVYKKKEGTPESGGPIYKARVVAKDDMLVACKNMIEVNNLKRLLSSEFDMKDLGEAKKILGIEIIRDRSADVLYLSQRRYIEKVLERFSMMHAKPVSTPLGSHFKLSKELCPQSKEEEKDMAHIPYTSAVGSVMYSMVCSRPDIAHAVSMVSRYMSRPGKVHWEVVKWLLRYFKGTSNVCLEFGRDANGLIGCCDLDYGGGLDDRKSTSGYVFTLGGTAKELLLKKIGTEENPADMLTKSLPTTKFTLCVDLVGLSLCSM
uniref:Reverse transcriptase Ty1/copia-type domain-containing protein n=1 Tax=Chenopodium quinoa TaxID=63459 RepID=A0A803N377_CHEQI